MFEPAPKSRGFVSILALIGLAVIALAIPVTLKLSQEVQIFKEKAAELETSQGTGACGECQRVEVREDCKETCAEEGEGNCRDEEYSCQQQTCVQREQDCETVPYPCKKQVFVCDEYNEVCSTVDYACKVDVDENNRAVWGTCQRESCTQGSCKTGHNEAEESTCTKEKCYEGQCIRYEARDATCTRKKCDTVCTRNESICTNVSTCAPAGDGTACQGGSCQGGSCRAEIAQAPAPEPEEAPEPPLPTAEPTEDPQVSPYCSAFMAQDCAFGCEPTNAGGECKPGPVEADGASGGEAESRGAAPAGGCGDKVCDLNETADSCPNDCEATTVVSPEPTPFAGDLTNADSWKCPGPNCDKCGYGGWWGAGCGNFCAANPNDGSCPRPGTELSGPLVACGSISLQCSSMGTVKCGESTGYKEVRCGNDGCFQDTGGNCQPTALAPPLASVPATPPVVTMTAPIVPFASACINANLGCETGFHAEETASGCACVADAGGGTATLTACQACLRQGNTPAECSGVCAISINLPPAAAPEETAEADVVPEPTVLPVLADTTPQNYCQTVNKFGTFFNYSDGESWKTGYCYDSGSNWKNGYFAEAVAADNFECDPEARGETYCSRLKKEWEAAQSYRKIFDNPVTANVSDYYVYGLPVDLTSQASTGALSEYTFGYDVSAVGKQFCSENAFGQFKVGGGYYRCRDGGTSFKEVSSPTADLGANETIACNPADSDCAEFRKTASTGWGDIRPVLGGFYIKDADTLDGVSNNFLKFMAGQNDGRSVGASLPDCSKDSAIKDSGQCRQFREGLKDWMGLIGAAPDSYPGKCDGDSLTGWWTKEQCAEVANYITFETNGWKQFNRTLMNPLGVLAAPGTVKMQRSDLISNTLNIAGGLGGGIALFKVAEIGGKAIAGGASTGPVMVATGALYGFTALGDRFVAVPGMKKDLEEILGIPCSLNGSSAEAASFDCGGSLDKQGELFGKMTEDMDKSKKKLKYFEPDRVQDLDLGGKSVDEVLTAAKMANDCRKSGVDLERCAGLDLDAYAESGNLSRAYAQYLLVGSGGSSILDVNREIDNANNAVVMTVGLGMVVPGALQIKPVQGAMAGVLSGAAKSPRIAGIGRGIGELKGGLASVIERRAPVLAKIGGKLDELNAGFEEFSSRGGLAGKIKGGLAKGGEVPVIEVPKPAEAPKPPEVPEVPKPAEPVVAERPIVPESNLVPKKPSSMVPYEQPKSLGEQIGDTIKKAEDDIRQRLEGINPFKSEPKAPVPEAPEAIRQLPAGEPVRQIEAPKPKTPVAPENKLVPHESTAMVPYEQPKSLGEQIGDTIKKTEDDIRRRIDGLNPFKPEPAKPIELPKTAEQPKLLEAPKPKEVPKPAQAVKPVEAPKTPVIDDLKGGISKLAEDVKGKISEIIPIEPKPVVPEPPKTIRSLAPEDIQAIKAEGQSMKMQGYSDSQVRNYINGKLNELGSQQGLDVKAIAAGTSEVVGDIDKNFGQVVSQVPLVEARNIAKRAVNSGTMTGGDLINSGVAPIESIRVGKAKISVSAPYTMGDRLGAVMYVEVDGQTYVRSLYKSNSQGVWRVASHGGPNGWFGKGIGEDAMFLPLEAQQRLNVLSTNPLKLEYSQAQRVFFGSMAKGGTTAPEEFVRAMEGRTSLKSLGKFTDRSLQDTYGRSYGRPDSFQWNNPSDAPDFSKLVAKYDYKACPNGMCNAEAYVFTSKNGEIQYLFFKEKSTGRVWVAGAEQVSAPINSFGIRSDGVSLGELGMPLYEYGSQIPGGFAGNHFYGSYYDAGAYVESLPINRDARKAIAELANSGKTPVKPKIPQTVSPEQRVYKFGRADDADIKIAGDRTVSRSHAQVTVEGERVKIADAGSKNGTRINGKEITGEVTLREGDIVKAGDTELRYSGIKDGVPGFESLQEISVVSVNPVISKPSLVEEAGQQVEKVIDGLRDKIDDLIPPKAETTGVPAAPTGSEPKIYKLGRADNADIKIANDGMVSRNHAQIAVDGNNVEITDIGSTNGTRVNGKVITGPTALKNGDVITVGGTNVKLNGIRNGVPEFEASGLGVMAGKPVPEVMPPVSGPKVYKLGRSADADIRITHDDFVSRSHAEVKVERTKVSIKDVGSSNGTSINGRAISGEVVLKNGDVVHVGNTDMVFKGIQDGIPEFEMPQVSPKAPAVPAAPVQPGRDVYVYTSGNGEQQLVIDLNNDTELINLLNRAEREINQIRAASGNKKSALEAVMEWRRANTAGDTALRDAAYLENGGQVKLGDVICSQSVCRERAFFQHILLDRLGIKSEVWVNDMVGSGRHAVTYVPGNDTILDSTNVFAKPISRAQYVKAVRGGEQNVLKYSVFDEPSGQSILNYKPNLTTKVTGPSAPATPTILDTAKNNLQKFGDKLDDQLKNLNPFKPKPAEAPLKDVPLKVEPAMPAIKPGEVFDAPAETGNILKLPSSERKAALNAVKDKIAYQEKGLTAFKEKILEDLRSDASIPLNDLLDRVDEFTETYGFTGKQSMDLENAVWQVQQRSASMNKIVHSFPSDRELYKALFGKYPQGKVEIVDGPVALFVRVSDETDFAFINEGARKGTFRGDIKINAKEIQDARSVAGYYLGDAEIYLPEAKGAVIVENMTETFRQGGDFGSMTTFLHEEQHVIDDILTDLLGVYNRGGSYSEAFVDIRLAGSDRELKEGVQKLVKVYRDGKVRPQTSSEILAYYREGTKLDTVEKALSFSDKKGDLYGFFDADHEEALGNVVSDLIGVTTDNPNNYKNLIDKVRKLVKDEFAATQNPSHLAEVAKGMESIRKLENLGYSREEIITILEKEPLDRWTAAANRLTPKQAPAAIKKAGPTLLDAVKSKLDDVRTNLDDWFNNLPFSKAKPVVEKAPEIPEPISRKLPAEKPKTIASYDRDVVGGAVTLRTELKENASVVVRIMDSKGKVLSAESVNPQNIDELLDQTDKMYFNGKQTGEKRSISWRFKNPGESVKDLNLASIYKAKYGISEGASPLPGLRIGNFTLKPLSINDIKEGLLLTPGYLAAGVAVGCGIGGVIGDYMNNPGAVNTVPYCKALNGLTNTVGEKIGLVTSPSPKVLKVVTMTPAEFCNYKCLLNKNTPTECHAACDQPQIEVTGFTNIAGSSDMIQSLEGLRNVNKRSYNYLASSPANEDKLYEIANYRSKIGLGPLPGELYSYDPESAGKKWKNLKSEFSTTGFSGEALQTGEVIKKILQTMYGDDIFKFVHGVKPGNLTAFYTGENDRTISYPPFNTWRPQDFVQLILHEGAGHGTDPSFFNSISPEKYLEMLAAKEEIISQVYSVRGMFFNHPQDQMLDTVRFDLGKDGVKNYLTNSIASPISITNSLHNLGIDNVSPQNITFTKNLTWNLGMQVTSSIITGYEKDPQLLGQYEKETFGPFAEMYAEAIKWMLIDESYLDPNDKDSLEAMKRLQENQMVKEGVEKILRIVSGDDAVTVDKIRADLRALKDSLPKIIGRPLPTPTAAGPVVSTPTMTVQEQTYLREASALDSFLRDKKVPDLSKANIPEDQKDMYINYFSFALEVLKRYPRAGEEHGDIKSAINAFDPPFMNFWESDEVTQALTNSKTAQLLSMIDQKADVRQFNDYIKKSTPILQSFVAKVFDQERKEREIEVFGVKIPSGTLANVPLEVYSQQQTASFNEVPDSGGISRELRGKAGVEIGDEKPVKPPEPELNNFVGFNSFNLGKDSAGGIQWNLTYLRENGVNTVRAFAFEKETMLNLLENVPPGADDMKFIIPLANFGEINENYPGGREGWFKEGYKEKYLPYVKWVADNVLKNPKYQNNLGVIELFNEPHCDTAECGAAEAVMMTEVAKILHDANPNVLISPGSMTVNMLAYEDGGEQYKKLTEIPYINANTCYAYTDDPNALNSCNQALNITKAEGKFFYVGELGNTGPGKGCSSPQGMPSCDALTLTNRAADLVDFTKQFTKSGAGGVMYWQYNPVQNAAVTPDNYSIYPNDPLFAKVSADPEIRAYVEMVKKVAAGSGSGPAGQASVPESIWKKVLDTMGSAVGVMGALQFLFAN